MVTFICPLYKPTTIDSPWNLEHPEKESSQPEKTFDIKIASMKVFLSGTYGVSWITYPASHSPPLTSTHVVVQLHILSVKVLTLNLRRFRFHCRPYPRHPPRTGPRSHHLRPIPV